MRSVDLLLSAALALAVAGCATPPSMPAQDAKPLAKYGKPISDADLALWNIDIRTTDGKGLPPGSGSVAQGKAIYDAKCAACHGADAKGGVRGRGRASSSPRRGSWHEYRQG